MQVYNSKNLFHIIKIEFVIDKMSWLKILISWFLVLLPWNIPKDRNDYNQDDQDSSLL